MRPLLSSRPGAFLAASALVATLGAGPALHARSAPIRAARIVPTSHASADTFPTFERVLQLEQTSETSANVSIGDLDGDGRLDIVLVKGRHWPLVDRVLLGDGAGHFAAPYDLGTASDRSYSGHLADLDRDGDLDVVISNDAPDPKRVYLNDGKGKFREGSTFGRPEWETRNATVADIDGDGLPDIVVANRSDTKPANYVCLNRGKGRFDADCIAFSRESATTITAADFNRDGLIDLAVPHRDGGQSRVYLAGAKGSFSPTRTVPFGPPNATIRMAEAVDLDGDGVLDLVAINEKTGAAIYFGKRDGTFATGVPVGDRTVAPYALAVGDVNGDGKPDIVVGNVEAPSAVHFNDGSGRKFHSIRIGDAKGTVYGFDIADLDRDGAMDIAAARSDAPNVVYFGHRTRGPAGGDARFDALVALTEAKMKEYGVPGVALGIIDGGGLTIRGLGITNVEDSLPVTAHTVFPIASISKTFAATAMMRLVEQGKIDLRAPVRTYIPSFKVRDDAVSRDVTVWHLLTHLGGWEGQVSGPDRGSTTLENFVATTLPDLMQVAPPGKAWSYNNAGFSIAGRVIEVATGTSINRAMRDLVFQPLGLEHAGTTAGDFIVNRFAAGHSTRDGKTDAPATVLTIRERHGGRRRALRHGPPDVRALPHGRRLRADGARVLTRASLEQMRMPQSTKQGTADSIGLAWHMRHVGPIRTYGHGGTLGGHILLLEIVPERNFAIAILTNANTGWRLIQDVEREALEDLPRRHVRAQPGHRAPRARRDAAVRAATRSPTGPDAVRRHVPAAEQLVRGPRGRREADRAEPPSGGGSPTDMPVSFFGPDRAVVTDGPDRGQAMEFVRDDGGRVTWIRVVGRVAVRAP